MSSITEQEHRGEYVAGLRALADLIEQEPAMPLPTSREVQWQFGFTYNDAERRAALANAARLMPCRLDKNDPAASDYNAKYFILTGNLRGLPVELWAERESVCRRVVTGTREVTKTVPAPDAPMVEVTETVEDVEWVCGPLLAEHTTAETSV